MDMGLQTAMGVDACTLCTAYLLHLNHEFHIEDTQVRFRDKDMIADDIKQARNSTLSAVIVYGSFISCMGECIWARGFPTALR